MSSLLEHSTLHSTLQGVESPTVTQFRGIRYGHIPKRFAAAESIKDYPARLDCTQYGYVYFPLFLQLNYL